MSILCVMYCDGLQARVYRTAYAPTELPAELTLGYQQVNFGGLMSDFVASLCRTISAHCKAGKFDRLVLMAPGSIWNAFDKNLDEECHARLLAVIAHDARSPPDTRDLLAQLRLALSNLTAEARSDIVKDNSPA